MAITTKQQRVQPRSEALQLIAGCVLPTDAVTQLTGTFSDPFSKPPRQWLAQAVN